MKTKIKALQIGLENWENNLTEEEKEQLEWFFVKANLVNEEEIKEIIDREKGGTFDVVLCTDQLNNDLLRDLSKVIEAYSLIIDQEFKDDTDSIIIKKKSPIFMCLEEKKIVLYEIVANFFSGQFGSKFHTNTIVIDENFEGEMKLSGEDYLQVFGDFSNYSNRPLLTWKHNIAFNQRSKKIWLEFSHDDNVRISMSILMIQSGTSNILNQETYSEEELEKGVVVDYKQGDSYLSISLLVEGKGKLKVGPLHYRDSRHQYGEFILGGEKIKDHKNQELFYYFHPGDLQPPLNVYFSGYRSAEGFEGFFMMKQLGAPFLLIADPRLEGGSFYMGSKELEESLVEIIQEKLQYLHFSHEQLILSGLSMGTYGSLYYASQLNPAFVIVGKPLINVGDIAANERIIRPGGFATSLDILKSLTGGLSPSNVKKLNQRFWEAFSRSDFLRTEFIIAYMKNDDYDSKAYEDLLGYLSQKKSLLIGKGLPGRHNDNSSGINQWFLKQYQRVLKEEFQRRL
ncbi:accessory Sec system protein Asp2 [Enterococcus mundtii]|uniref:Accessory Sec system protein Asp2 n=1 Tax=Enterococcus mundtii TaxID=53346 RepID=A0A242KUX0_ENTMU|nr:accessory Sec system protein Asp2 [Enterococcus mundtii]OTP24838.1 accessory Sec system protein Asp2 [Enterococcus mundtii]